MNESAPPCAAPECEGEPDESFLGTPLCRAHAVKANRRARINVGVFALVTLLVAPFGDAAIAAGSIGGNVATVVFMIPNGLGMAATIRVGHAIGAGDTIVQSSA